MSLACVRRVTFRVGDEFVLYTELLPGNRAAGTEDEVTEILWAAMRTTAASQKQQNENRDVAERARKPHHRFMTARSG